LAFDGSNRDNCFDLLHKLVANRKGLLGRGLPIPIKDIRHFPEPASGQMSDLTQEESEDRDVTSSSNVAVSALADRPQPSPDSVVQKMSIMVDEELGCTVEQFMRLFWEECSPFYE